jgi:hypothetical protein
MAVLVGTVAWWIIPVIILLQPRNEVAGVGFAFACLVVIGLALGLCAQFRQVPWIVLIWVPLVCWTGLGALKTFSTILSEPTGGADAAPLQAVAVLIVLGAGLILSTGTILGWVWRPRVFSLPLLVLAIANTCVVSYVTLAANRRATHQGIILQVLDSQGRPLPGASVRYARYGYGPGGREAFDAAGGPLTSGPDGLVVIPSRRMRYATKGTINKPGFRDVLFTVEMQFSKWDHDRGVTISTSETKDIARGRIPASDPVTLSIYVPPLTDAPRSSDPVKRREARSDIGRHPDAARFLNVETGEFSTAPATDLRFDVFFVKDGRHERPRLRITGLNGARLLHVPPSVSFSGSLSPYEHVFRIAPEGGYQDEVVIEDPSSSPGPMIYVAARGGRFYARMTVNARAQSDRTNAPCTVQIFTRTTGGRLLE